MYEVETVVLPNGTVINKSDYKEPAVQQKKEDKASAKKKPSGKKVMKIIADNFQERMDVCLACPFVNETKTRCTKCGCVLKLKLAIARSKCPSSVKAWGWPENEVK